ncbi:MAG: hypothetical protein JWN72_821 [Thermoleophilia bacterium]|nr:hypothetical protein [Thermoleophilia bacterium]
MQRIDPMTSHDVMTKPNLPGHALVAAAVSLCVGVLAFELIFGDNGFVSLLVHPVVVTLVPLVMRTRRWPRVFAAVLVAPMATYIFSVGIFYAPAMLLLIIAACLPPRIDWDDMYTAALAEHDTPDAPAVPASPRPDRLQP